MHDHVRAKGRYIFEGFSPSGILLFREERENLLTQLFFTGIFKFFNQDTDAPAVASLNFNYIAIGTGTTAPAKSDTVLGTEYFRKAIATKIRTSSVFTSKMQLDLTEGNITIREVGVFANGSGTSGSGSLMSHAAVNIIKTDQIKLTISHILTLEEI